MPSIGFRLSSIRAERYSFDPVTHLNINMNIMFGRPMKKDSGYEIEFVLKIDCAPPIASIDLKGSVVVVPIDSSEAKKLDEDFSKPVPPQQLVVAVYSYVLPIVALLSRELALPPPVQIPIPTKPPDTEAKHGPEYHM